MMKPDKDYALINFDSEYNLNDDFYSIEQSISIFSFTILKKYKFFVLIFFFIIQEILPNIIVLL